MVTQTTKVESFDLLLSFDTDDVDVNLLTVSGPVGWNAFPNWVAPGQLLIGGFTSNETPVLAGGTLVKVSIGLNPGVDASVPVTLEGSYNDPAVAIVSETFTLTQSAAPILDEEATGTLNVTGAAEEGGSLSASLINVLDADGATTTTYRWQELVNATWTDLSGATTATLAIPDDQSFVGKQLRVVATTTDVLGGTTIFEGTAQTIANIDDEVTGIKITGSKFTADKLEFEVVTQTTSVESFDLLLSFDTDDVDANLLTVSGPVGWNAFWNWVAPEQLLIGGFTSNESSVPAGGTLVKVSIGLKPGVDASVPVTLEGSYNDPGVAIQPETFTLTQSTAPVLDVQVSFWKGLAALQGTVIEAEGGTSTTTGSDGQAELPGPTGQSTALQVSRAVPVAEVARSEGSVNLQDAVTILKMIAGQPTDTTPVSRFQSLAADFDGSGTVSLADALGVLRHSVGLPAPTPSWVFVEEGDYAVPSILNPGIPGAVTVDVTPPGSIEVHIIGVLRGDVDGSYGVYGG